MAQFGSPDPVFDSPVNWIVPLPFPAENSSAVPSQINAAEPAVSPHQTHLIPRLAGLLQIKLKLQTPQHIIANLSLVAHPD